jgi:hypothetical protein
VGEWMRGRGEMIDGTGPIPGYRYRYRWNGEAVAYFPGVDSPAPRA